jgi:predicted enzyme related to lactoylglutathione lyase
MSTTEAPAVVTGVDFVSVPTRDLERAVEFYGETLDLPRSMYKPERNFAEFETGTVTLSVVNPEKMGIGEFKPNANHLALHVEDVAAARATLEERGVSFMGDTFDTGVCHMAFFADPDGNMLMLHHRYAPRVPGERFGGRVTKPAQIRINEI